LACSPQQEDKSGDTALLKLARQVSETTLESKLLQVHIAAAPHFIKHWNQLSASASSNLLSYLLMVKVPLPSILEPARKMLKVLQTQDLLSQRADLMRLMSMSLWKFSQECLLEETALMANRPALWFDLAWSTSPDFAIAFLGKLPRTPTFVAAIASRFPYLGKTAGPAYVEAIVSEYSTTDDTVGSQKLRNALKVLKMPSATTLSNRNRYQKFIIEVRDSLRTSQPLVFQPSA
jgi:hypothetical protein